jgi:hypothetical protein
MAPLRWVFLGAAAPKPEADARLGAALDAPVFGRGFALPKLGIVLLIPLYVNEHGQSKPQK